MVPKNCGWVEDPSIYQDIEVQEGYLYEEDNDEFLESDD